MKRFLPLFILPLLIWISCEDNDGGEDNDGDEFVITSQHRIFASENWKFMNWVEFVYFTLIRLDRQFAGLWHYSPKFSYAKMSENFQI